MQGLTVTGADVRTIAKFGDPVEVLLQHAARETEANVMAGAVDLSNIRQLGLDVRGLLGLNVLKNFRVTLDFERKVMRLEPNLARSVR